MIRFAYVVRTVFSVVLIAVLSVMLRASQILGLDSIASYTLCAIVAALYTSFYYFKIEYNFNFILIRFNLNPKKWLSLILKSIDFLIYSLLRFGKSTLIFFFCLTVIPTGAVLLEKYIIYPGIDPERIHANIAFAILGFLTGYIDRKFLASNIQKVNLKIINFTDWLRFATVLGITLTALGFATKYEILGELVFGFCLGLSLDFYLLLSQRSRTFAIRRGLRTYTYIKNVPQIPKEFKENLLLGKTAKLEQIIRRKSTECSKNGRPTRNHHLMKCSFYFFQNDIGKLEQYYEKSLSDTHKADLWFRHLIAGTKFAKGNIEDGINELLDILRELEKKNIEDDDRRLIPHVKVNLSAFYNTRYSYFGENIQDLKDAIKYCRQAVNEDQDCALSKINLAYYLAKSVDLMSDKEREKTLNEAEKFLNDALYKFSRSPDFPWYDCSTRRIIFSNIFFTDVRGYIYMKKKIYKSAMDDFTDCILKDPLYARGHFHLAQLLERLSLNMRSVEDVAFQFLKVMTVLHAKLPHYPMLELARKNLYRTVEEEEDIKYWQPRVPWANAASTFEK